MRYYRDVDYYLYFEDFPRAGVYGAAVSNTNGTVNVYINTLYGRETQERTIRHELRHIAKGHLWDDVKLITEKELEADDPEGCDFGKEFSFIEWTPEPGDIVAECPRELIPEFCSLGALCRYYSDLSARLAERSR